jgi:hypothetical protein
MWDRTANRRPRTLCDGATLARGSRVAHAAGGARGRGDASVPPIVGAALCIKSRGQLTEEIEEDPFTSNTTARPLTFLSLRIARRNRGV